MPRKAAKSSETEKGTFPTRLRDLMERNRVSQQKLADAVGMTRQAISNYMLGQTSPDWETIAAIAKYFDISADYLLGIDNVDTDIWAVSRYTGLASDVLKALHESDQELQIGLTDQDKISRTLLVNRNSSGDWLRYFINDILHYKAGITFLKNYWTIFCDSGGYDIENFDADKLDGLSKTELSREITRVDRYREHMQYLLYSFSESAKEYVKQYFSIPRNEKELDNFRDKAIRLYFEKMGVGDDGKH